MEAKFIEYFENFHKNHKNLSNQSNPQIVKNPTKQWKKISLPPSKKPGMFATQFDMKMAAQFYTVTKRKLQRKKITNQKILGY